MKDFNKEKIVENVCNYYNESFTKYRDADEFMVAWFNRLIEDTVSGKCGWNDEINFIAESTNVKLKNITLKNKVKDGSPRYLVLVNPQDPVNPKRSKQISAGTYATVSEAIRAREVAKGYVERYSEGQLSYNEMYDLIRAISPKREKTDFEKGFEAAINLLKTKGANFITTEQIEKLFSAVN